MHITFGIRYIDIMKTKRIHFPNRNGLTLSADLDLPIGEKPKVFAILAHCFTCGKNLKAAQNLSLALSQNGVATLRFDFAGIGQSEGEFYDTNFSANVQDILDVADYLKQNYQAPQLLIGHSLGGTAVIQTNSQIESVKAIATVGAPAEPEHVKHLFSSIEDKIRKQGKGKVEIAGRPFVIKKHFLDDIESIKLEDVIHNLKKALLVLHSPQDQIVNIDNAKDIYTAAMHPKSFLTLDGADHLMMKKEDSMYAGNMIANWATRYLDLEEKNPLVTDRQVVVRTGAKGYTTEIRAGKHTLLADEPEHVGGDDLGPMPYDFLLSGLGACTSITLRMYADRKGWDLKEVRVHLEHYKDYVSDAEETGNPRSKLDHIERIVELEGNLDEEQRQRLFEIANRCPVHRTLHSEIIVKSSLRE